MSKMTPKFAIKVLCSTKVAPIEGIPGSPVRYGYQNQAFYDKARNMAVAALKENVALRKQVKALSARLAEFEKGDSPGEKPVI